MRQVQLIAVPLVAHELGDQRILGCTGIPFFRLDPEQHAKGECHFLFRLCCEIVDNTKSILLTNGCQADVNKPKANLTKIKRCGFWATKKPPEGGYEGEKLLSVDRAGSFYHSAIDANESVYFVVRNNLIFEAGVIRSNDQISVSFPVESFYLE